MTSPALSPRIWSWSSSQSLVPGFQIPCSSSFLEPFPYLCPFPGMFMRVHGCSSPSPLSACDHDRGACDLEPPAFPWRTCPAVRPTSSFLPACAMRGLGVHVYIQACPPTLNFILNVSDHGCGSVVLLSFLACSPSIMIATIVIAVSGDSTVIMVEVYLGLSTLVETLTYCLLSCLPQPCSLRSGYPHEPGAISRIRRIRWRTTVFIL